MSVKIVHDAILASAQADTALSTEFGSEIKKGFEKELALSKIGKAMRVSFVSSGEVSTGLSNSRVLAIYGFNIGIGFYDPDPVSAEDRKSEYDKMLRDWVDSDLSFGGVCLELSSLGTMGFTEDEFGDGYYFGTVPLICQKYEQTGNR